jgi:hypothetical protein
VIVGRKDGAEHADHVARKRQAKNQLHAQKIANRRAQQHGHRHSPKGATGDPPQLFLRQRELAPQVGQNVSADDKRKGRRDQSDTASNK